MISEGDTVVASLPQSDGTVKLRPVVLLKVLPGFGDFLAAGVSCLATIIIEFDDN